MSAARERGWLDRLNAWGSEREALLVAGASIDHARVAEIARTLAARLSALGVEPGDLVAVLVPPSVGGVALMHAMLDRRFVALPLNARLTEREQTDALHAARARILIAAAGEDAARGERLAAAAGCGLLSLESTGGERGSAAGLALVRPPVEDPPGEQRRQRERLLAADAALVLFTSGTSGRSKGAVLTFSNLIASAEASTRLLGFAEDDRWLLCMPLFHIGGISILVRSALVGTSVVLHERFDADRVAWALEEERVTRVSLVATMLDKLIAVRGMRAVPKSLALVLLGGGSAPQELLARARAAGYPIAPTYGLTEAASQVATRPPFTEPSREDDLAAGLQPLPGVAIRVVDAHGDPVPIGQAGEIQVRGTIVMESYLDDPEATRKALVGGWLATGDLGRLDERGGLRVLDRRDDLIVSGGENVYPAELESVVVEHPDVEAVGVVGRADAEFGARPVAFVVLRDGVSLDALDLAAFCRARLAGYKIPVAFIAIPELPRTGTGKLLRRALSARLAST